MGIITYSNLSVYHHRKWKDIRIMVTYAVWIEKDTGECEISSAEKFLEEI